MHKGKTGKQNTTTINVQSLCVCVYIYIIVFRQEENSVRKITFIPLLMKDISSLVPAMTL